MTRVLKSDSFIYIEKEDQIRIYNFHLFKATALVTANPEARWQRVLQPHLEQNHLVTACCFPTSQTQLN